jgi:mRNA-degrading endonuclease YafQ of YafQ-DinJ toxin-antitoxin module
MVATEHHKWERSGRHSKGLDALLLETVNMLAKDEPLPHRYFDHPLSGEWNDHREAFSAKRKRAMANAVERHFAEEEGRKVADAAK